MSLFSTREVLFKVETAFAENAAAPASNDWDHNLHLTNATFTPDQPRDDDKSVRAKRDDHAPGYLMPKTCTFTLEGYLCGHNTTAAGALTPTGIHKLLKVIFGGGTTAGSGTAIDSATDADTFVVDSGVGWANGMLGRIGQKNDARCDGQAFALGTGGGTANFQALTALPATPNAGDVVYGMQCVYPDESVTLGSFRLLMGWTKTGAQYHLMGCQAETVQFGLALNGMPTFSISGRAAYFELGTVAIPFTSIAQDACNTAPIGGGSCFFQTVGTATRALLSVTGVQVTLDMGLIDIPGLAGVTGYQAIKGYERSRITPRVAITADWSTAHDALYQLDGPDSTYKHILLTFIPYDKKAIALYLPRAYIVGPIPTVTELNGLLHQTVTFAGRKGPTATTALTEAPFVLGQG